MNVWPRAFRVRFVSVKLRALVLVLVLVGCVLHPSSPSSLWSPASNAPPRYPLRIRSPPGSTVFGPCMCYRFSVNAFLGWTCCALSNGHWLAVVVESSRGVIAKLTHCCELGTAETDDDQHPSFATPRDPSLGRRIDFWRLCTQPAGLSNFRVGNRRRRIFRRLAPAAAPLLSWKLCWEGKRNTKIWTLNRIAYQVEHGINAINDNNGNDPSPTRGLPSRPTPICAPSRC